MKFNYKSFFVILSLVTTQFWIMSCSGGHVTQNGIFQDGHKELKASLEGSWRIVSPDAKLIGSELFEFYNDNKKIKLKVNGKDQEVKRLDSDGGLSFTFEYLNENGQKMYVVGQFKSSAMKSLVLMQEAVGDSNSSLNSILLEKRSGKSETVAVNSNR